MAEEVGVALSASGTRSSPEAGADHHKPFTDSLVLKSVGGGDRTLSSLISDQRMREVYKTVDNIMADLYTLMYWKMVDVKYEEDCIEGDDYRIALTSLGKAALRVNGDRVD